MKAGISVVLTVVIFSILSHAQGKSGERVFLPSDTFWGYAQFDIAPPHNEIDPNLCAATAGNFGGVNAPCNAFARYMLSGLVGVGLTLRGSSGL